MKRKILIVDDEPHMRMLAAFSLGKGDYDFIFAEDGIDVQDIVINQLPDLIVMDVRMPQLDGLAALRKLRSEPALYLIPVIMLTGLGTISPENVGATGANALITKPFSPTQLQDTARKLLADSLA